MLWIVCPLSPSTRATEMDYEVLLTDRKQHITTVFLREEAAVRRAEELASSNPKVAYAVMAVKTVIETTKPQFVRKVVNDRNELVLDKSNG